MNLYDKASLILTPNAYKASKLYALKPTNGSGDLTFTRASAKRRRNASGVLEALANNVPALEYPVGGGCPAWDLEPQRTNLFWPSDPSSGGINCTFAANDWGIGFNNKVILTNTVSGALIYGSQPHTFTQGVTYTISAFVRIIDGQTGTPLFGTSGSHQGYFNVGGTAITAGNYKVINVTENVWYIEGTAVCGASVNSTGFLRWVSNRVGSIEVTGLQVEAGTYATSYIATLTGAVTRVADNSLTTGLSPLIGQSEGVLYWEGTCEFLTDLVGINQSTVNGLYITKGSGSLFRATIYANSVAIGFADVGVKTTKVKIALAYKSGDSALFVNGAQIGSTNTTVFTFTGALSAIRLNDNYLIGSQAHSVNAVIMYPTRLSNAELAALTTL